MGSDAVQRAMAEERGIDARRLAGGRWARLREGVPALRRVPLPYGPSVTEPPAATRWLERGGRSA